MDVGKLLGQLKRCEKARSDTESQLKTVQKTVQEYKESAEKHTSVKEKLQVSFIYKKCQNHIEAQIYLVALC